MDDRERADAFLYPSAFTASIALQLVYHNKRTKLARESLHFEKKARESLFILGLSLYKAT
jgi:hypothetical protein